MSDFSYLDDAPPPEDPGYLDSIIQDFSLPPSERTEAVTRAREILRSCMVALSTDEAGVAERQSVARQLAGSTADLAWLSVLFPSEWEVGCNALSSMGGFTQRVKDLRRAVTATAAPLQAMLTKERRRIPPSTRPAPDSVRGWPREDAALERCTDLGNARRFVQAYGEDVRWCATMPFDGWLTWTGSRWAHDETGSAMRLAKLVPRLIRAEADRAADEAKDVSPDAARKERMDWADSTENVSRLSAILTVASTEPEIVVAHDRFDRDPLVFNTPTGTIDLATGTVQACSRADLLMHEAGVGYDPAATCPRWEAFVWEIMGWNASLPADDPSNVAAAEMVAYIQRVAGYCLLGEIREPAFFIFWGGGRNGKGTLVERFRKVMGTYAANTPTSTFVGRKEGGIPNDLAALAGKRLVTMSESEDGERLEEALIKQVTGKDPITARFMRGEFFDFFPVFTPILSTNDKPAIHGIGPALRARLHLVPFTVSFEGREDLTLADALDKELAGILNWCLAGFAAYQKHGLGKPKTVVDAVNAYMEEMDSIGRFLSDRCKILSPVEVENKRGADNSALYAAYREWAIEVGEKPKQQKWLTAGLKARKYEQRVDDKRWWPTIGLAIPARESAEGSWGKGKRG